MQEKQELELIFPEGSAKIRLSEGEEFKEALARATRVMMAVEV